MNEQQKIQEEIDRIIGTIPRAWKLGRITLKAIARIDELGLTGYIPAWMLQKGAKSDAYINKVIAEAENAGGKKVTESGFHSGGDGYATTTTTEPGELYKLLNPPQETTPEERTITPHKGGRTERMEVRLTPDELAELDHQRGELSRSDYITGLVSDQITKQHEQGNLIIYHDALWDEYVVTERVYDLNYKTGLPRQTATDIAKFKALNEAQVYVSQHATTQLRKVGGKLAHSSYAHLTYMRQERYRRAK